MMKNLWIFIFILVGGYVSYRNIAFSLSESIEENEDQILVDMLSEKRNDLHQALFQNQVSGLDVDSPSNAPSVMPTGSPSSQPTSSPTKSPTNQPTSQPSAQPVLAPTSKPSGQPTRQPTGQPSRQPSRQPTAQPSRMPTGQPSRQPTRQPTSQPSRHPTGQPSSQPSRKPTSQPTRQPTTQPTSQPSRKPSGQPSSSPTSQPTVKPCELCGSGTYFQPVECSSGVNLGCISCPMGFSCDGGCSQPSACGAGRYQPALGQSSCLNCPAGTYNLIPGQNNCTACPAGFECNKTNVAPVMCRAGFYSIGYQTNCSACPGGSYSTFAGMSQCTACPGGHRCPIATSSPIICNAGTYAVSGSDSCTTCPPGFSCPSTSLAIAYPCTNGTYSTGGATQCNVCPRGHACPSTSQAIERPCANGTYSLGGQSECTPCPAGHECDIFGRSIKPCDPGWYSLEGDGVCTRCPAGFRCPSTNLATTIACLNGTYAIAGSSGCTSCPPGYACPYTDRSIETPCIAGTFSIGKQTACTVCVAGYECPSMTSNTMVPCAAGYYSLAGYQSCQICPAGRYCPSRSSAPISCPAGSYSSAGQTACTIAPAGRYVPSAQATSSLQCASGYYSTGGAVQCTLCDAGYLCPAGSTSPTSGTACPIGYYCPQGSAAIACPVGTYGVMTGAGSQAQACRTCEAGYFCGGGNARGVCPAGAYCPAGTTAIMYCPPGTSSFASGQSAPSTCKQCEKGKYCNSYGNNNNGTTCPAHYYCPEGTSNYLSFPCPQGTYSEATGLYSAAQCLNCTVGHYCTGASSPSACPAGTYNPYYGGTSSASCLACEAGFACPSAGMSSMLHLCDPGHYCPPGTVNPSQYACPAGTYSDSTSLVSVNGCSACPAGYTCGVSATTDTLFDCALGHYCIGGVALGQDTPCPPGRYSNSARLTSAAECSLCPAGKYCLGGNSTESGTCPQGHYCPIGTTTATQFPCPAGTYSNSRGLYSSTQCQLCQAGYYCPAGSPSMNPCSAGYYSNANGTSINSCLQCRGGYYCPATSSAEIECGVGNYSAPLSSSCSVCPLGHYCGSNTTSSTALLTGGGSWSQASDPSGVCFNGTYCPMGMTRAPDLLRDACPAGYYCPAGTPYPIACPSGRYNPVTGQSFLSDCLITPAGFYSTNASTGPTGQCHPGYYCPAQSTGPQQIPCPARTYLPEYGGASVSDCSICVAGGYCPQASSKPIVCPQGSYCPTGVSNPLPCLPGTYGNTTGLVSSDECLACTGGYYCDGYGLRAPRGLCTHGFYCFSGSNTSTPYHVPSIGTNLSVIGDICPKGSYCLAGSVVPTPCPAGTFNPTIGAISHTFCTSCTPGYYCEGTGNYKPTGQCEAGYFCVGGASTPTQYEATAGHYAIAGSANQSYCSPGTYNMQTRQSACLPCEAGYYCPEIGMKILTNYLCIPGHYCPQGTVNPYKCPPGTYTSQTGNMNISQCTICPPGKYCAFDGRANVTGPCAAGYYCSKGASLSVQATVTSAGGPCPAGSYCLEGSGAPTPCPVGSYMPTLRNDGALYYNSRQTYCQLCPAGKACITTGLRNYSTVVEAGYWSIAGAPSVRPVCLHGNCTGDYGICPTGSYCPVNSTIPTICPAGAYQDDVGQGQCKVCPAGHYCLANSTTPVVCPAGSYCPAGTRYHNEFLCPNGTYSAVTGLQAVTNCTSCTPGYYCGSRGLTSPTAVCDAGYFCGGGSSVATPFDSGKSGYRVSYVGDTCISASNTTLNDVCPAGHYCPAGSVSPIQCPPGTNSSSDGLQAVSDCPLCTKGFYCPSNGTVLASASCLAGYYCPAGTAVLTNDLICPRGAHCPTGSAAPVLCGDGTYQDQEGQASCKVCPAGHYCVVNTTTPVICPAGSYCPAGTRYHNEFLCPNGTYSAVTGLQAVTNCTSCTPGYYCGSRGLTSPTAVCDAGYFCGGGSSVATPFDSGKSGYRVSYVGDTCISASNTTLNDVCPAGHYCPAGSVSPIQCPPGTNSSSEGLQAVSDCPLCTKGFYCPSNGTVLASASCLAGYYCPAGTAVLTNDLICPRGAHCPTGSAAPVLCGDGTYQDQEGQASCKVCPAGHYCVVNTTTPVICPAGSYCPAGTRYHNEFLCPNGTYSAVTGLQAVTNCTSCTPGYYCGSRGLTSPTAVCDAGYFCGGGSSVATPFDSGKSGYRVSYVGDTCISASNTTLNDVCPAGHYCPAGSVSPIQCPPGTNSSSEGLQAVSDCPLCTKGFYCPSNGTVLASASCLAGYYCPAGTAVLTNDLICPRGAHCPTGSAAPVLCGDGTYQDQEGQASCKVCPAGHYCVVNTTTPVICPAGSYCPAGTRYHNEFLCPNGTYSAVTGLQAVTNCTSCTPGYYCGSRGLTSPTAVCDAGYFCGGGSSVATPFDSGKSGYRVSYVGDTCISASNTTLNDVCPAGHYCPAGSVSPIQCPPGTNSSSEGLQAVSDCPLCTKGFYCPSNGTVLASASCLAGYYCPAGTAVLTNDLICPRGAHCPTGSAAPVLCGDGTYQDQEGQASCKVCPAGHYCVVNTTTPVICPAGSYCPAGTRYHNEFLCPNGTYSAVTGLQAVTNCTSCTPGYYCGSRGLTSPTAVCDAGYFCGGGSSVATPFDSGKSGYRVSYVGDTCISASNTTLNDVCPAGHYCPAGSVSPIQCPPGTNSSSEGLQAVSDCPLCTKGFYCPSNGTVLASASCLAGYYCPAGTAVLTNDLICPRGAHCPTGSAAPVLCGDGTYQDQEGQASCKVCPAGHYCVVNTTTPVICPAGSYCPAGTRYHNEFLCPNGTYSAVTGLQAVTNCTSCTPGYYCGSRGLTSPTAVCDAGYFCGGGSSVATPFDSGKSGYRVSYVGDTCISASNTTLNDVCPAGHYCPAGSVSPIQCPPGTNSSSEGLQAVSDCPLCTKGFYCPSNGTVLASASCLAGYYCPAGTAVLTNDLICPRGAHCPTGSAAPVLCGDGTYQDQEGQASCKVCPAGHYCVVNTTTPVICPAGSYCPAGTRYHNEFLCPNGTYSAVTGLQAVTNCTSCTPGYYCGSRGLTSPTAVCDAGYFCGGGSSVATPFDSGKSGYRVSYVGDTCISASNTTLNDVCPAGHYCPAGSVSPIQCPPGTNSSSEGLQAVSDCPLCTKGFYCPSNGTVLASASCLAGYYCPAGTAVLTNDLICPRGAHCPTGSAAPVLCGDGTYQDQEGQASCKVCPAGHYCVVNTTTPVICPAGSYCPAGTRYHNEFLCPNGTYSAVTGLQAVTNCTSCTPGYYCGSRGLTSPTAVCDAGYFCGGGSSVATPFDSGKSGYRVSYVGDTCISASNTTLNDVCPAGHYCPAGSVSPIQCPPGTNSSSEGLQAVSDCPLCTKGFYCPSNGTVLASASCLAGYYCPAGTAVLTNDLICPRGAHCPTGSAAPVLCGDGTYQDQEGQASCKVCPAGHYCVVNTTTPVICPAGSYCPAGTRYHNEFLCPNGTYSAVTGLQAVTNCTSCTPGYYCGSRGLTSPTAVCDAGYFCGGGSSVATPFDSGKSGYRVSYVGDTCISASNTTLNDVCPAGHYCPAGSVSPIQCPPGTNSSSEGLQAVSDCPLCTKGFYCPSNGTVLASASCLAGYYCPAGTAVLTNDLICPRGAHCPTGSAAPVLCGDGTYQDQEGQASCKVCPAGHYCVVNTTTPVICPAGSYCPAGTRYHNEFLCPNGTYSAVTGLQAVTNCTSCTPGYYCGSRGLTSPTAVCDAGYFCGGGSSVATPFDSGKSGYRVSYVGDTCISASNTTLNDVCPAGHYCPAGSVSPIQCPPGTNSSSEGLQAVSDCPLCTKGFYCPSNGTVLASASCLAGYYCPAGTAVLTNDLICPRGAHCPTGSAAPVLCGDGTYQDQEGQASCKVCPAGHYCVVNTTTPVICPAGSYCPAGTRYHNEFLCPNGTYSAVTGLQAVTNCTSCTPGYYCGSRGLTSPTAVCDAGYFCGGGSSVATPFDSGKSGYRVSYVGDTCISASNTTLNDVCPAGHYCPAGSVSPIQCPPGTNSSSEGLQAVSDCPLCTKGFYCPSNGTVLASASCLAGYYCPAGTAVLTNDLICPRGAHCPTGSAAPVLCGDGTYQDQEGQASCKVCPAGHYCVVNTTTPVICPAGSYCPAGTRYHNEFLCPNGTYSAVTGLQAVTNCTSCTPGYYCGSRGLTSPTAVCDAGYFCGGGSSVATPFDSGKSGYRVSYVGDTCISASNTTLNDVCPAGHYCPAGSVSPIQCPPGTNSSSEGLQAVSDCPLCTKGFYCPSNGTVLASAECLAGYYCPDGTATPSLLCPNGTMCPLGSSSPVICPAGTFQDETGRSSCKPCTAGYVCGIGTIKPTTLCPIGRYCPQGSSLGHFCANGTYSVTPGLVNQQSCTPCPPSKYCTNGAIVGNCSEGYFCKVGQLTPVPYVNLTRFGLDSYAMLTYLNPLNGGPCPPGHYCPAGTAIPISCPNKTVRSDAFGSSPDDCGPCPAGYTCEIGDPVPTACARGKYCPGNSQPIDCPVGTYNSLLGRINLDDCSYCPAGYYCNSTGITTYSRWPCPVGHYCTLGTLAPTSCPGGTYRDVVGGSTVSSCFICPSGHYCSAGSTSFVTCPRGTYCPAGSANTTVCPGGYYCPANSSNPIACPSSYYCPAGSSAPRRCDLGSYCPSRTTFPVPCPLGYRAVNVPNNSLSVLGSLSSGCEACPGGYYGNDPDRLECYLGLPGFYYLGGTTTSQPTNVTTEKGDVCPIGHYCPAGTTDPLPCPAGSYLDFTGATNSSQCKACAAGTYQYKTGSGSCFQCSSSSTSKSGSTICTCIGKNRAFQPVSGYCICQPGYEFVDSNLQVSSTADGSYDCQPIVYPQCTTDETRLFDGSCATDSYCSTPCGAQGGKLTSTTGTCICNNITTLAEICDETCRSQAITVTCDSDNNLVYYFPLTNSYVSVPVDDLDTLGSISCSEGSSVYSMSTTDKTFTGVFGTNEALNNVARRRLTALSYGYYSNDTTITSNTSYNQGSRKLASSGASAEIKNPIVTIYVGDSIVFDVSKTSYPVYVKDSLLNSNPTFDYSAFRNLASTASTTLAVTTFSFTFNEAGTYVFTISSDSSIIAIIIVLESNIAQQTAAQYVEFSENNLIVSGVKTDDNIVLSPDWNLVIGLLLGMLAIVLLVVAFLYYFRKKSWSYHTSIDQSYRKQNKQTSFDGKHGPGKGGLFSKHNKVFADGAKDGNQKEEGVKKDEEDLESPAFPDDANLQEDEDGLLPELAKHLQSHHDEIDRQLLTQNDILTALQETLKREVDDLKALLQSTAMEISLNSSADQRNKKLQTILLQLRADALARDSFENNTDTTERRIVASIGQLKESLLAGPEVIAAMVVQDLSDQAAHLNSLDEEVTGMTSPLLQQLGEYLGQMSYFTKNDFLLAMDDEKRRRKSAEDTFDAALKSLQAIVFPPEVLDCWKVSKDCDVVTDVAMENAVTVLRSFCDHIPQFVNFMTEAQASFNRGLGRTVEKGNTSLIEKEQDLARESFTGYLRDLLEAIGILENALGERLNTVLESENEGKTAREKLIEAIDAALAALQATEGSNTTGSGAFDPNSFQQLLEPLLAALREGRGLPLLPGQSSDDNNNLAGIPEGEEEEDGETSKMDSLLANENLTTSQKETILESDEHDQLRMESLLEMEKKRNEEEIQNALATSREVEEDSSSAKFREEQKRLQEQLQKAREEELAKITEDPTATATTDIPRLVTRLRSMIIYRHWAMLSRAKYCEFSVDRLVHRSKLFDQLVTKHSTTLSSETLKTAFLKFAEEEKKELQTLRDSLQKGLQRQSQELINDYVTQLSPDLTTIDLSQESKRVEGEMNKTREAVSSIFTKTRQTVQSSLPLLERVRETLRLRLLQGEESSEPAIVLAFESITNETMTVETLLLSRLEEEVNWCEREKRDLTAAISDFLKVYQPAATSSSPVSLTTTATAEKQRFEHFHLMLLGALQVHSSLENRLALLEFEHSAESDRIKVWTDLYQQSVDIDEQRVVFGDLSRQKQQEQQTLQEKLQAQILKAHQVEVDRQQQFLLSSQSTGTTTAIDYEVLYEKERAAALEMTLWRHQQLAIQRLKSQMTMEAQLSATASHRRQVILQKLEKEATRPELLAVMKRRFTVDNARVKAEIASSYTRFEESSLVLHHYCLDLLSTATSYSTSVTNRSEVNPLVAMVTNYYYQSNLETLLTIAKLEDVGKRNRIAWNTTHHRIYEEQRIQILERSTDDLQRMYADIQQHAQEEYKALDVSTAAELWKLKNSSQLSLDEKQLIHSRYFQETDTVWSDCLAQLSQLRKASSAISLESWQQSLVKVSQSNDEIFDLFKATISKLISHQKVEDELATIRRTLQNESDEVEELIHLNEVTRLQELLAQQQQRKTNDWQTQASLAADLSGQIQTLEEEKQRQLALAEQIADLRQQERERQLVSEGLTSREAKQLASEEREAILAQELAAIHQKYDQLIRAMQEAAEKELQQDLRREQSQADAAVTALSEGKAVTGPEAALLASTLKQNLEEEKTLAAAQRDQELLEMTKKIESDRLESEKAIAEEMDIFEEQRKQQLIGEGMTATEAAETAAAERRELQNQKLSELANRLEADLLREQAIIQSKYADRLQAIDNSFATAVDLLNKGFDQALKDGMDRLQQQLQRKLEEKTQLLMQTEGLSEAEARAKVISQNNEKVQQYAQQVKDVQQQLIAEIAPQTLQQQRENIQAKFDTATKGLEVALQRKQQQQKQRLAERLQRHAQHQAKKLQAENPSLSLKEAEAQAKDILAASQLAQQLSSAIDSENDRLLKAKQNDLQRTTQELQEKTPEQAMLEDQESMQLRQELREKTKQMLSNDNNSTANVLSAATEAAKAQQLQAEKEVSAIRDAYKTEMKKLEHDYETKMQQEKSHLQQRLAQRQRQREQELQRQQPSASPSQISQQVAEEMQQAVQELEDRLILEKESKLQEMKKQALQAESALLEREHQKLRELMKDAEDNKQHLQQEINQIKARHEDDNKSLQSRLEAKKRQQEEALKQRLAHRKAQKLALQSQSDPNISEADRQKLQQELDAEEQQLLQDLHRQQLAEEEAAKERQRQEQEAALAKVMAELRQAEAAAAIALAKEKTLETIKSMQTQAEQDNNLKEVQKLRAMHDLREEKRQQEISQAKSQGKEKLNERLAIKRAKREKELKEQEEKALAELAAKQKAEAEEKERLRQAKLSWSEKLQEIITFARTTMTSVTAREREDYCCQQVFHHRKQQISIPESQLNEAISMIFKDRHDEEMTQLLTHNFEERIASLRTAVEAIIEEKSQAKIHLVESLSEQGANDEKIRQELLALDEQYMTKQMQAEKSATAALENKHVKAQLELKRQQLLEIAEIVSLYTDPETLKRIQQQTAAGKNLSPEEQLQQYQQRLESERKAREAQLQKEREESEQRLRQQLQEEMAKLESEIASEQQKVTAEYEKKRQEVLKQKEALDKKQSQEKEELEKLEKQRILQNFEKEQAAALESLNADRMTKKARLTERLNRRRSTVAANNAATAGGAPLSIQTGEDNKPLEIVGSPSLKSLPRNDSSLRLAGSKSKAALASINEAVGTPIPVAIPPQLTQSINLIESKLERIEKVISALEKSGLSSSSSNAITTSNTTGITPATSTIAPPTIPVYQDPAEPAPGDRLEVVADADLAVQERARLDFGKKLATMIGIKNLNLQSATSLPPSPWINNSFGNSYYYLGGAENTLYVHHNRLSSSGDFGLVVIHALSHIKVNSHDLSNDNDPKFMTEFYKNLKILSQDLYKKTAVTQTTNPLLVGKGGAGTMMGGTTSGLPTGNKRQRSRSSFNLYNNSDQSNELQQSMLLAAALGEDGPPSPHPHGTHPSFENTTNTNQSLMNTNREDYFSQDSLIERMKTYAQQGGIPLDYFERYSANTAAASNNNNNPK